MSSNNMRGGEYKGDVRAVLDRTWVGWHVSVPRDAPGFDIKAVRNGVRVGVVCTCQRKLTRQSRMLECVPGGRFDFVVMVFSGKWGPVQELEIRSAERCSYVHWDPESASQEDLSVSLRDVLQRIEKTPNPLPPNPPKQGEAVAQMSAPAPPPNPPKRAKAVAQMPASAPPSRAHNYFYKTPEELRAYLDGNDKTRLLRVSLGPIELIKGRGWKRSGSNFDTRTVWVRPGTTIREMLNDIRSHLLGCGLEWIGDSFSCSQHDLPEDLSGYFKLSFDRNHPILRKGDLVDGCTVDCYVEVNEKKEYLNFNVKAVRPPPPPSPTP